MFQTKNSKITVYGLAKAETPNIYLTFVLRKQDLNEYLKKFILLEHFEHYRIWCTWNQHDICSKASEQLYFDTCIDPKELNTYIVKKLRYKLEDIVGILRMFGNCLPLECSFELPYEDAYFKAKFASLETNSDGDDSTAETSEVSNGSE